MNRLPFMDRLVVPAIAAPMLRVSGIELVSAACAAGVIGAFPTANCTSLDEFAAWLQRLQREAEEQPGRAPHCPNLIMRRDPARLQAGVDLIVHHAERAVEAGVDGLVLLSSGAGGHTGWANPFAFVRAVRQMFDGPIVLSGGLSDGVALRAATVLGCDLGCVGTRFIATQESMATADYKEMLLESSMDDVLATRAFTGLPANFLKPSIVRVGLDPEALDETVSVQEARRKFGGGSEGPVIQRWSDLWSAGHSVSGVTSLPTTADLVQSMKREYLAA